jgi:hypothetical protein
MINHVASTRSVDSIISTYGSGSDDDKRQQANPFASTLKSLEDSVAKDSDANCEKIDLGNLSSAEDFPYPLMPTWRVVRSQRFSASIQSKYQQVSGRVPAS